MPDRRESRRAVDAMAWILVLAGLYWFAASFFLAKRSLSQVSSCDEARVLLYETLKLGQTSGTGSVVQRRLDSILSSSASRRGGCWMDRVVDSMVFIVVDALRFDFALYNLPKSIGKRLDKAKHHASISKVADHTILTASATSYSKLYQFVADPPTVTMQRLKALTTGGLPTFADISSNFGGGTVDDDSWIRQVLLERNWERRGLSRNAKAAFVGDDTWDDLFPNIFTESYPYPSFNTRDLDTVDNGCLSHVPDLISRLRHSENSNETTTTGNDDDLELVVVHFLGVDHVGHTYGPHNQHMDAKLRQMDDALASVLDFLDSSDSCHAAMILGDHGMTEDGNHGGGTEEEVNAALFVHMSAACHVRESDKNDGPSRMDAGFLDTSRHSDLVQAAFSSIHQIDLVPTLSIMLGIPIPYANLGSLVPSLIPSQSIAAITTALALNAAQVWRYFTFYSNTANKLPGLPELESKLAMGIKMFEDALHQDDPEADEYFQAATLFKFYLREALELGQRVWTRFDDTGMTIGIIIITIGLICYAAPLVRPEKVRLLPSSQFWEVSVTTVFMVFQCGLLTFSNSYILEEQHTIMFCLTIVSVILALRIRRESAHDIMWRAVLLLPMASRLNEFFVFGHGMDPSTGLYAAHSAACFLSSLFVFGAFRWYLFQKQIIVSLWTTSEDYVVLLCLAKSWWEKSSVEPNHNGYTASTVALAIIFVSTPGMILRALLANRNAKKGKRKALDVIPFEGVSIEILLKLLLAIMAVTGPSSVTSLVLYTFQAVVVFHLSEHEKLSSLVVAASWRLVTRHVFFATNHGCFFNRLQYSAAFVATEEFYFVLGGISLFLNTFGYEIVGLLFAWLCSRHPERSNVWRIYGLFQLFEALTSCISVSVLRRHLMVWDVYAPHFIWIAIFTGLNGIAQQVVSISSGRQVDKRTQ